MNLEWPNHWPMLSKPVEQPKLRILSLGAGVQSTVLALAAARREAGPMPDCAIFADTGGEPRRVYEHLDWLDTQVPFPIIRVRRPGLSLGDYAIENTQHPKEGRMQVPFYTADPIGMLDKQCSREWKTRVVTAEVRRQLGVPAKARVPKGITVEMWIGISKDEIERCKDHECSWITNRWVLVEADMTRAGCFRWLEERQYPRPPKSSCIFCPFRDNQAWLDMGRNEPEDFADAITIDEAIRAGYVGMTGQAYIHRNRIPLRDLDLTKPTEQVEFDFLEPCYGGCGS